MTERIYTAGLVVIGDEILSGRTHDKNIAQIASWLQVQGIRLSEVRVVPDVIERIVEAVNALREGYDYLFTTGGRLGQGYCHFSATCTVLGPRRGNHWRGSICVGPVRYPSIDDFFMLYARP